MADASSTMDADNKNAYVERALCQRALEEICNKQAAYRKRADERRAAIRAELELKYSAAEVEERMYKRSKQGYEQIYFAAIDETQRKKESAKAAQEERFRWAARFRQHHFHITTITQKRNNMALLSALMSKMITSEHMKMFLPKAEKSRSRTGYLCVYLLRGSFEARSKPRSSSDSERIGIYPTCEEAAVRRFLYCEMKSAVFDFEFKEFIKSCVHFRTVGYNRF